METEAKLFRALSDPTRIRLAIQLALHGEACVCFLAEALGMPHFKASRHLGVLKSAGFVVSRRSGKWMYYRLASPRGILDRCLQDCFKDCFRDHPTVSKDSGRFEGFKCSDARGSALRRPRVLFLCTGNSCRSQMAEGWARAMLGDSVEAFSAGIETHGLNPHAVRAMAEAGVDISKHESKTVAGLLSRFPGLEFDLVVTVCGHANETCPIFPGAPRVIHAGFDDPPRRANELAAAGASDIEQFDCYRRVRDEIRAFVEGIPKFFLQNE